MTEAAPQFEIFLVCPPGLELVLVEEARLAGFADPKHVPGGVAIQGGWADVWRANLTMRGAGRVLARIAEFRAFHLAQLDKRARKVDWATVLGEGARVRVEVSTKRSKIYHAKAAAQRIERALVEEAGAQIAADGVRLKVRIDDNLVQISIDSSGEALYKRGYKHAVNKAPLRETLASLFLSAAGYDGSQPVFDPMCGSGTLVIEAAERALGLLPGRMRAFDFERLGGFDPALFETMKSVPTRRSPLRFVGSDRDAGAIKMAAENADRAGVGAITRFDCCPLSDAQPPDGPPGLVLCNPPYGGRIGNVRALYGLYATFGEVMRTRFPGWRVGFLTSNMGLANATNLALEPGPWIDNGGIRIRLFQTVIQRQ